MTPEERKDYQKAYYEKNKERLLAEQRERGRRNYLANPEAYAKRSQAWRENNREKYLAMQREYSEKNKDKIKERSASWYAENKERAAKQAYVAKLAKYGLTPKDYERILKNQDGVCAICSAMVGLKSKSYRLYVDHCHVTGKVRGLLCNKCNAALGMLNDSPELIMRAHQYLTRS